MSASSFASKIVNFWQPRANFWTVIQDKLKITIHNFIQHDFRKKVKRFRLLDGFFVVPRESYHQGDISLLVWKLHQSLQTKKKIPMFHCSFGEHVTFINTSSWNLVLFMSKSRDSKFQTPWSILGNNYYFLPNWTFHPSLIRHFEQKLTFTVCYGKSVALLQMAKFLPSRLLFTFKCLVVNNRRISGYGRQKSLDRPLMISLWKTWDPW